MVRNKPLRAAVAVVASLLAVTPAHAATVSLQTLFAVDGQSLWASGPAFRLDKADRFGPPAWDIGKTIGGIREDCFLGVCSRIGARIGADTRGDVGLDYKLKVDSGSVDLRYPLQASFSFPDANTVEVNKPFTISSSFTPLPRGVKYIRAIGPPFTASSPGMSLQTRTPTLQASLDLAAKLHAFAGAEACFVVACYGPAFAPPDIDASRELAAVNRNGDGQVRLDGTVVSPTTSVSALGGLINAWLAVPDVSASSRLTAGGISGANLNTYKRSTALGIGANVAQIAADSVGFTYPLEGNFAGIAYNLLQANAGLTLGIEQSLGFVPKPMATLRFTNPVRLLLPDGSYAAPSTTITFELGQSITLKSGYTRTLGVIPTISLDNRTTNTTGVRLGGSFDLSALGVDVFGLRIGPLIDERIPDAGIASLPIYRNDFELAAGDLLTTPFNLEFTQFFPDRVTNICTFSLTGSCSEDQYFVEDSADDTDFIGLRACDILGECGPSDFVTRTAKRVATTDGGLLFLTALEQLFLDDVRVQARIDDDVSDAALLATLYAGAPPFVLGVGDPRPPGSVPEAASLALLALGLGGLALGKQRLRRRRC